MRQLNQLIKHIVRLENPYNRSYFFLKLDPCAAQVIHILSLSSIQLNNMFLDAINNLDSIICNSDLL